MIMNWGLLLYLLEYFSILKKRNLTFQNADCILLLEEESEDLPNMAYVVSECLPERHFAASLLIYPQKSRMISDNYILTGAASASEILNRLLQVQSYLNIFSEHLSAARTNQEAIELASAYTEAPYFYFDASYRILAIAGDVDPEKDPEWKHMTEKRFLSPETTRLMQNSGDLDMLADQQEPFLYHAGFFPCPSLVCNIWIDGQFYSRLNMLGLKGEPNELNRQECRILCRHLLRIAVSAGSPESRSGPLSQMVRDLLQGLYLSEDYIHDQLELRPQLKNSLVQVCCIEPNMGNDPQVPHYYTSLLDRLFAGDNVLSLIFQDKIVLVLHAPDEEGFQMFHEKLEPLLSAQGLTCGVSNVFHRFNQLRYYYLQAFGILSLADGNHPMAFFREKYSEYLLSFIPREQAIAMISPDVIRLMQMQPEYQFSLTQTLQAYLDCGCNLQKTADRLFIHKNTALYRMGHIRQLLHADLEDADQRFQLWLSFQILGLYPVRL
mgnify:CR=1 FL=1